MAASFAAYASQYLNRQQHGQQQQGGVGSTLSSSHPMFFSFSTEGGSRGGHGPDSALLDDYDLDDPHLNLGGSGASESTARRGGEGGGVHGHGQAGDEDDDPYLRLDEDERTGKHGFETREHQQSAPLIAADENDNASLSSSNSGSPKGGWLAHLAASPSLHMAAPTPRVARSPSPAGSSSSSDSAPPPELFAGPSTKKGQQQKNNHRPPPPPRTQRQEPHSLSLTESLLPRDGRTRPLDVFSLPDPRHAPRGRRKHNDSIWTSAWLAGVSICVVSSIILLFAARQPDSRIPRRIIPYVTLLRTVPLLTILTFVSAAVAYLHIFLLQVFVRPVMIATSVFIPVTLLISALWAFIGSFMWEEGTDPTWGETVGLRLFSIIPLLLAIYTGRRLLKLPQQIHTTSSTLTLTTHLLMLNPFLLALSPAVLLAMLLSSLPFLTLIFRLLLFGSATSPARNSGWEWHLHAWVNWAITGSVGVWLWTWGVARGVMRMTTASVIGAWYFADPSLPPPPPASTHTIHSALFRATGQSLGTTALSALILTAIRMLTLLTILLQRAPAYLPLRVVGIVMPAVRFIIGWIDGITTALSKYALVYAGLTGDDFISSARRSRALTSGVESAIMLRGRRRGFGKEPPLTLLTISPLVLTFPFALMTYLFVAHTLKAPHEALGASVLAGGVTALVGLFCVGLVKDTADTLYLCYCIDKDTGDRKREEVFVIFEPENSAATHPSRTTEQQQQQGAHQQPAVPSNTRQQPFKHPQPASPPQRQRPSFSQTPQHHMPSFTSSPSKAPLGGGGTPGTKGAIGTRTQPLEASTTMSFLSDEDSPSPRDGDGDVDPFKKSLMDDMKGLEMSEDDMYGDEPQLQVSSKVPVRGVQQYQPQNQNQELQNQQAFVPQHQRQGSTGSPFGKSPPQVNAFIQRNRGFSFSDGRSPPTAVGLGMGAGVGYFPDRERGQERMLTSTELNMKSHVFEGRGRGIDLDSESEDEEGSVRLPPQGLTGVGSQELEEGDVNPFEAAGDLERGVSLSQSSRKDDAGAGKGKEKDMEESDLFPGSGFFN